VHESRDLFVHFNDNVLHVVMCWGRFLVSVEAAELPIIVILNKSDLIAPERCHAAVAEVHVCFICLSLHITSILSQRYFDMGMATSSRRRKGTASSFLCI
jgi:putative ribosome biogenesis GTPase RsgA